MSINDEQNFDVIFEGFAERHFIKHFRRKYKKAWDVTKNAIIAEFKRIDNILGCNDYTETIKSKDCFRLIKLYFKIAGTNESKRGSGNRVIGIVNIKARICKILLVYSKNNICSPNETQKWQLIIKTNYPEIWNNLF